MNDQHFQTENWRESAWKHTTDIAIHGARIGAVDVYYVEERPQGNEGRFRKEERALLDATGERLGRITERKRTTYELNRVCDLSLDPLCVAGLDGAFKRLNRAFEVALGYSREERLTMSVADLVHPRDRAASITQIQRLSVALAEDWKGRGLSCSSVCINHLFVLHSP